MATWTYSGNIYDASPPGTTTFPLTTEAGNAINYLQRSHIHVYKSVDSGASYNELTFESDYQFNEEGTSIVLNAGIAAGEYIKLLRITPYQTEYVEYQASSQLTAGQLNTGEKFSMYVDQELYDDITVVNEGFIADAPDDGKLYGRQSEAWAEVPTSDVQEAPADGKLYGREDEAWVEIPPPGISDAPADSKEYVRYNSTWKEATEIDAGVTKIVAGDNITISPTSGVGDVTITAEGGSSDLPIASSTVLGGIKVGNNLVIDVNGVLSATGGGGGGGDVISVNGKVGTVVLTAADVGALPEDWASLPELP